MNDNKDFMVEMTLIQRIKLLEEMRISKKENPKLIFYNLINNKMRIFHSPIRKGGPKLESVFTQFEIIKIYNSEPSEYDQSRFRNFMISEFGDEYEKRLKSYLRKKDENELDK